MHNFIHIRSLDTKLFAHQNSIQENRENIRKESSYAHQNSRFVRAFSYKVLVGLVKCEKALAQIQILILHVFFVILVISS